MQHIGGIVADVMRKIAERNQGLTAEVSDDTVSPMPSMTRFLVFLTEAQTAHVERVKAETGASAAEIIRRLLDKALALTGAK